MEGNKESEQDITHWPSDRALRFAMLIIAVISIAAALLAIALLVRGVQ